MLDPDWQISVEGETMLQIPVKAIAKTGMFNCITPRLRCLSRPNTGIWLFFLVPHLDMHFKKKCAEKKNFNVMAALWRY